MIAKAISTSGDTAGRPTAEAVRDRWKATTRVDTGAHRDSIQVVVTPGGHAVIADSDHSAFVELGTRRMRGDHAGFQAAADERDAYVERMKKAINP